MPGAMEDAVLRAELVLARGFALVRAGHSAEARRRCAEGALLAEQAGRPALALDARIGEAACAAAQGRIADVLVVLESVPGPRPHRPEPGLPELGRARPRPLAPGQPRRGRRGRARRSCGSPGASAAPSWRRRPRPIVGLALLAAGRGAGGPLVARGRARGRGRARAARGAAARGGRGVPRRRATPRRRRRTSTASPSSPSAPPTTRGPDRPPGPGHRAAAPGGRATCAAGCEHLAAAEERLRRVIEDVRSDEVAGEELLAVMLDLGRPPVAGISDHAGELARVSEERRHAMAAAEVAGGRRDAGLPRGHRLRRPRPPTSGAWSTTRRG